MIRSNSIRVAVAVSLFLWGVGPSIAHAQPLRGDLNNDRKVDISDQQVLRDLLAHYRHRTPGRSFMIPDEADLNNNGRLGKVDLRIMRKLIRRYKDNGQPDNTPEGSLPLTASALRMGANLDAVTYYSPQWAFVDCFKQSGVWLSQTATTWNDGRTISVRADGGILLQPGQWAGALIYRDIGAHFPGGTYVCTYDGLGKITFALSAKTISQTGNRILVDVTPAQTGILLRVEQSDSTNPVRNIKLWMPGFEGASSPFHPTFLDRIRGHKVIRFMDWGQTNNSTLSSWSDRTLPTIGTQGGPRGVAVEYMVDLCNTLNADAWFCMPHLADDNFVRSFAALVRDRLGPNRKVYLEYSNETWNGIFSQSQYMIQQGQARNLDPNQYEAGRRYYTSRAVQIFNIWEQVFGGRNRLVRVIASQAANPWLSDDLLGWNGTATHADALAIAPYFYATGIESKASPTLDDVFSYCEQFIRTTVPDRIKLHKQTADKYGLALIAYEGGQHLVQANNDTLTNLYLAANRDRRMYDLYTLYFNAWAAQNSAGLFMNFTDIYVPGKYGSWGTLEYQDQPISEAHKYRASQDARTGTLPYRQVGTSQLKSLGAYD